MKFLKKVICFVLILALLPIVSLPVQAETTQASEILVENEVNKPVESLEGKTISILGASISTYAGTSNGAAADTTNSTIRNNAKYYPHATVNDVTLNDTWWMQVAEDLGLRLLVNNSWSGSSLLHERSGTVGAYVDRCVQLHDDTGENVGEAPDIIGIQMGTNDFQYYKDTLGTADIDYGTLILDNGDGTCNYSEPVTSLEAAAIVMHKISVRYPNAEVYYLNISQRVDGTDALIQEFNAELSKVCEHFGVHIVDIYGSAITMEDFDTYIGDGRVHPNKLGMDVYTESFKKAVIENTAYDVDTHIVSFELDNAKADYGTDKLVVSGDAFSVNLTTDTGSVLDVSVVMGGEDITESVYSDGVVSIDAVTSDVTITAKGVHEPKSYRWEFDGTDLVSVTIDGNEENTLIKNAGSTTNGVFSTTKYALENEVVLAHDMPWVVEWKSEGTWRNSGTSSGGRLFTTTDVNAEYNARYVFKSANSYLIAMGEKTTTGSHNYGVALSEYGIDGSALHTYRLENHIANDGTNMVYLFVDGKETGPMNQYYIGTTSQGTTSDWLNGKDFVFPYIGTDTHGLNNCSIEYIQVSEDGTSSDYHIHEYSAWEVISTPSADALGLETRTCSSCGNIQEREVEGVWQKYALTDHLVSLPDEICQGTNLWPVLAHDEYYFTSSNAWNIHSSKTVYSVTIPVSEGDQIYASSFGKGGVNGHSSVNGIRVTFFDAYGVCKTLSSEETYAEFSANGYLTMPEGTIAVNVPMWTNSEAWELYILNKDHEYSNTACTICNETHPNADNYSGKVISILGDSISTFAGYIPKADGFNLEHLARYPQDNLLTDVNETWWMQVITELEAKLGINDSWRGSTVSGYPSVTTGVAGYLAAMSNLTQIQNLGSNGTPDVILFYGGTNDLAHTPKLGSFNPESAPSEVDLTTPKWDNLADAYANTLLRLQHFYPDTQIICLLPTYTASYYSNDKLAQGNAMLANICEHYGVTYVDLRYCGISTENLPDGIHPDATGMDYITNSVLETLLASNEASVGENVVYSITHELENAESSLSYYKGISEGNSFIETLSGENLSVVVTMGGEDITDSCYKNGVISIENVTGDIVITAKATFSLGEHLQKLPNPYYGIDLWSALEHDDEYFYMDEWTVHSSGKVYSVTIPVIPGEKIYASSFEASGVNGGSMNGIRITFFSDEGVLTSMGPADVYEEFAESGYVIVPEGATAVNIPMWTNDSNWKMYIWEDSYEPSFGLGNHLQQLPEKICPCVNLWKVLEPQNDYYTSTGWGNLATNQVWSVTIPVDAGYKIYANSFKKKEESGNNYNSTNGIRVTYFGQNGVLQTLTADQTYAEYLANGYITAPEGAVAVNIPMWTNSDENELYILNLVHSYDSVVTEPTCTETGYTTLVCTVCGDTKLETQTMDISGLFTWTSGKMIIATTGACQDYSYWQASDYVDVSSFDSIQILTANTINTGTTAGLAFYDANKKYISGIKHTDGVGKEYGTLLHIIEIPENAVYVRSTWYLPSHPNYSSTFGEFSCIAIGQHVPATGHKYELVSTTAPTCTTQGTSVYTCSDCGGSYTEYVNRAEHTYDDGICTVCSVSILGSDWIVPDFAEGDYTMVVLPDTQNLVQNWPQIYYNQMQWIADSKDTLNIQAVLHMGDMVNTNNDTQWTVCEAGTDIVNAAGIPWMPMMGNHDNSVWFNKYYDFATYGTNQSWFGGSYHKDKLDHTYWFVNAGNREYLILSLGWAPSWDVLTWAQGIVEEHDDKSVILVDHAYMNKDGTLLSQGDAHCVSSYYSGYPDGDDVWAAFKGYGNVVLAMGGHIHSPDVATYVDQNGAGRDVTSLLFDRQDDDTKNRYAMIALLTFHADSNTVDINWYSTRYDAFYRANNQFSINVSDVCAHSYASADVKPTCTEGGGTKYTCTICGHKYWENKKAPLGHSFNNNICTTCGLIQIDMTEQFTDWTEGGPVLFSDGWGYGESGYTQGSNKNLKYSRFISVEGIDILELTVCARMGNNAGGGYAFYTDKGAEYFISEGASIRNGNGASAEGTVIHTITVPEDAKYIRVSYWVDSTSYASAVPFSCIGYADHLHIYTSIVTAPTCTKQGYTTCTCECGDSYVDDYVEETGHTEVIDEAIAPSCIATGLTEGKHCAVCEMILVAQEVIEANGHTYTSFVTAPTCETKGYTVDECKYCDYKSEKRDIVGALGHTWETEYTIEKAPTYIETGSKSIRCSVCKTVKEGSLTNIPKLDASGLKNPFMDNIKGQYYYDAVLWAYYAGITSGTSSTTFEPDASCTRGQVVTFLWRTAGQPEPGSTYNPFNDVILTDPSVYYGDAVLWAVNKDITYGTSATTFSPDMAVTRSQFVTFLWRAAGSPEPTITNHTFKDIKSGEYYYKAVLWAVENGITYGTSSTTFDPDADCTRGQVVTFLYRTYGK